MRAHIVGGICRGGPAHRARYGDRQRVVNAGCVQERPHGRAPGAELIIRPQHECAVEGHAGYGGEAIEDEVDERGRERGRGTRE